VTAITRIDPAIFAAVRASNLPRLMAKIEKFFAISRAQGTLVDPS